MLNACTLFPSCCSCLDAPIRVAKTKWGLTALFVSVVVIGLMGALSGSYGLSPLVHQISFFSPLAAWNTTQLVALIISGIVLVGGGFAALAALHVPAHTPFVEENVLREIDHLEKLYQLPRQSVAQVREFLINGFADYLELYGFYYHLATLSEHFIRQGESDVWRSFLKSIDGTPITSHDYSVSITVDASIECARLQGPIAWDLLIEEWRPRPGTLAYQNDLHAMLQIGRGAFPDWEETVNEQCFRAQGQILVIRERQTGEILSFTFYEDMRDKLGRLCLMFHTLARKPSVVKFKLTQKMWEYAKRWRHYHAFYIEVLLDNTPARRIYERLGFQIIAKATDHYLMVYKNLSQK